MSSCGQSHYGDSLSLHGIGIKPSPPFPPGWVSTMGWAVRIAQNCIWREVFIFSEVDTIGLNTWYGFIRFKLSGRLALQIPFNWTLNANFGGLPMVSPATGLDVFLPDPSRRILCESPISGNTVQTFNVSACVLADYLELIMPPSHGSNGSAGVVGIACLSSNTKKPYGLRSK